MKQLQISSPVFKNRGTIPSKYTCDGEDINPPLIFENVPEDIQSLTLLVEDLDSYGKPWLHWAILNIDPRTTHVSEDSVPGNCIEIMTDFGKAEYGGPCPANGIHRYIFKLFALNQTLEVTEDTTLAEIYHAIEGHIIERAELIGLYERG